MNRTLAAGTLAGALVLGGLAAAILPSMVAAADPSASPVPGQSTAPTQGTVPAGPGVACQGGAGMGQHVETVTDTSVAAQAIGISESDLVSALQSGKSLADVAKANNVDAQKVIDALVADEKAEISAAVAAGTETQVQADAELANLTARITDRVNQAGFGPGTHAGPGGPGMGRHDDQNGTPQTAPSAAPVS